MKNLKEGISASAVVLLLFLKPEYTHSCANDTESFGLVLYVPLVHYYFGKFLSDHCARKRKSATF